MRNVILLSFLTLLISLSSCKTDAERREECEREAEKLANEFINNSISKEDRLLVKDLFTLVKENDVSSTCKELKHSVNEEDNSESIDVLIKDLFSISEVEDDARYEQYKYKESECIKIMGFEHTNPSEFTSHISIYFDKDSLSKYLEEDIYDGEDVEEFVNYAQDRLSRIKSDKAPYIPTMESLRKVEYIGFIEGEYRYPPLILESGSFDSGVVCAKLKIYRLSDKSAILDKRIFATNNSELEGGYYVAFKNKDGRKTGSIQKSDKERLDENLAARLQLEVVLQAIKAGVPCK